MKSTILKEYDNNKTLLVDFKTKMIQLVGELLKGNEINAHQITGRLKERQSLEFKIDRKKDKYSKLEDITDIVGIRIITYLESDVDRVAEIIETEFQIDIDNSVDKRQLELDQFGYRSLHYVVSCNQDRCKLIEYKRFKNIKYEIQIRSILQHAWAEIEHDLGYKGLSSIPNRYKRDFNRLAALLESADIEFDRLKQELKKYENEVTELSINQPESVDINQASLISFIKTNETMINASKLIAKNVGCQFSQVTDHKSEIDKFINFFGITTIKELEKSLDEHQQLYLNFVDEFTKDLNYQYLPESLPIFYYQHFLAGIDEDEDIMNQYLNFGEGSISGKPSYFFKFIKKIKNR